MVAAVRAGQTNRHQLWWMDEFCCRYLMRRYHVGTVELAAPGEPPCAHFRLEGSAAATRRWILLERRHRHVNLLCEHALSTDELARHPLVGALLRTSWPETLIGQLLRGREGEEQQSTAPERAGGS